MISNLIQTQLAAAAGLTAKVQAYPTSEIYGWIGTSRSRLRPRVFPRRWPGRTRRPRIRGGTSPGDPDGGLNTWAAQAPPVTDALARGLPTGSDADFSAAGLEAAVKTGCWLNVADVKDFMVAQPWLKDIEAAHVVTNPNSLRLAALSVG